MKIFNCSFLLVFLFSACSPKIDQTIKTSTPVKTKQELVNIEYWHARPTTLPKEVYNFNTDAIDGLLDLKEKDIVMASGYFHESEIRIPMKKDGKEGYIIVKPFQCSGEKLAETNFDADADSDLIWMKFNSFLVNLGWTSSKSAPHEFSNKTTSVLGDETISITAYFKTMDDSTTDTSPTVISSENKAYTFKELWDEINKQVKDRKLFPTGLSEISCMVELVN